MTIDGDDDEEDTMIMQVDALFIQYFGYQGGRSSPPGKDTDTVVVCQTDNRQSTQHMHFQICRPLLDFAVC